MNKDDPGQDPALAPLLAISQQALQACKPLWPDPQQTTGAGLALADAGKDGGKALANTPSGVVRLPSGVIHVSVTIPFPGVAPEMLEWWMAAFCEDAIRYKLWCGACVWLVLCRVRRNGAKHPLTHQHIQPPIRDGSIRYAAALTLLSGTHSTRRHTGTPLTTSGASGTPPTTAPPPQIGPLGTSTGSAGPSARQSAEPPKPTSSTSSNPRTM